MSEVTQILAAMEKGACRAEDLLPVESKRQCPLSPRTLLPPGPRTLPTPCGRTIGPVITGSARRSLRKMSPIHLKLMRVVRAETTAQWALLLSTLLALVLASGCASLKPPDPPPLCEQPDPSSSDAAGWWALGWALQVIGPWLSNR